MGFELEASSNAKLKGVHPDLSAVMHRAAELSPVRFRIIEGLRDAARQKKLKASGASQVTVSRHQSGHAVDVAAIVGNKVDWDFKHYPPINAAVQKAAGELGVPVTWGGVWKSLKDGGHFELPKARYPVGAATVARPMVLKMDDRGPAVKALQERLAELNYHSGGIDGHFGNLTRSSVLAFQADNHLDTDGIAGPQVQAMLLTAKPRPLEAKRVNTTSAELAKKDPISATASNNTAIGAAATVGGTLTLAEQATGILGRVTPALSPVKEFAQEYGYILLAAAIMLIGAFVWWQSRKTKEIRLDEHRTGASVGDLASEGE